MSKVSEAAKWALEQSDGKNCPFCPWEANQSSDRRALSMHMRGSHKTRLVAAHEQETLEPQVREDKDGSTEDVLEAVGITQVDELDRFDQLFVPEALKQKAASAGDYLRWVAPRNIAQNKNRGAVEVTLTEAGEEGVRQASTEGGGVKTGEMVLMRFPQQLAERRRAQKDSRVEAGLKARAEEIAGSRGDTEKLLYDHYRQKGLDNTQASQLAKAQAGLAEREASRDVRRGLYERDQRGERAY